MVCCQREWHMLPAHSSLGCRYVNTAASVTTFSFNFFQFLSFAFSNSSFLIAIFHSPTDDLMTWDCSSQFVYLYLQWFSIDVDLLQVNVNLAATPKRCRGVLKVRPVITSAIERQNALTPKMRFSQNWYLWNRENEGNVTVVVGYAYLVIIFWHNDKIGVTHHNSYIRLVRQIP